MAAATQRVCDLPGFVEREFTMPAGLGGSNFSVQAIATAQGHWTNCAVWLDVPFDAANGTFRIALYARNGTARQRIANANISLLEQTAASRVCGVIVQAAGMPCEAFEAELEVDPIAVAVPGVARVRLECWGDQSDFQPFATIRSEYDGDRRATLPIVGTLDTSEDGSFNTPLRQGGAIQADLDYGKPGNARLYGYDPAGSANQKWLAVRVNSATGALKVESSSTTITPSDAITNVAAASPGAIAFGMAFDAVGGVNLWKRVPHEALITAADAQSVAGAKRVHATPQLYNGASYDRARGGVLTAGTPTGWANVISSGVYRLSPGAVTDGQASPFITNDRGRLKVETSATNLASIARTTANATTTSGSTAAFTPVAATSRRIVVANTHPTEPVYLAQLTGTTTSLYAWKLLAQETLTIDGSALQIYAVTPTVTVGLVFFEYSGAH